MSKLRLAVGLFLGAAACMSNPSIDGSTVPKIGSVSSPPSCTDLCARLRKLCGYAPVDCTNDDAGGYCDTQFDSSHRVCAGQAASCKDAIDCVNEPVDGDTDAAADVAVPDAGGDDAGGSDAKGE